MNNATLGLYDSGLGDLASMDGPGGFLPGPNISEGDPTIQLASDPNFPFTAAFGDQLVGWQLCRRRVVSPSRRDSRRLD